MWYDITYDSYICYKIVIYVTVTVIQLYNTEKNIKDSKIDDII